MWNPVMWSETVGLRIRPLHEATKSVSVLVLQIWYCLVKHDLVTLVVVTMILKDTATVTVRVLFIVPLFCGWNITTVEINSGVYLLKSCIHQVPLFTCGDLGLVSSGLCLGLVCSAVLVLLFWCWFWYYFGILVLSWCWEFGTVYMTGEISSAWRCSALHSPVAARRRVTTSRRSFRLACLVNKQYIGLAVYSLLPAKWRYVCYQAFVNLTAVTSCAGSSTWTRTSTKRREYPCVSFPVPVIGLL